MTRIGELFAGYGGLGMAVQQVYGGELAWYSEFDDAPSRIMAHHHPDVPNYGDVTQIDWSAVEPVDILTGGFPCQDVSVAGRRAGMTDGTRSGLWSHMAHAIDVLRPQLVVIENVGGLFSAEATSVVESHPLCLGDGGSGSDTVLLRAIDAVLSTLSELGYDAEWTALRAADVGAPHGRLRVFITAHPSGGGSGGRAALPLTGGTGGADAATVGADHRPGPSGGAAGLKVLPTPRAGSGMSSPLRPGAKNTTRLEDAVAVNLLPTPTVNDMGASYTPEQWDEWTARMKAEHGNGNGHGKSLSVEAARLMPTPRATDGTNGGPNQRGSRGDLMLPSAVAQLLPTPRALDATGVRGVTENRSAEANARAGRTLTDVTRLLPTPVSQPSGNTPEEHLRKKPGRDVVTDLAIIAEHGLLESGGRLLPTPGANLGENGGPQHPDKRRAGGHSVSIEDAVHGLIPTPSVADAMGGHERRGGARGDELLLKGLAKEGHLDRFGPYAPVIARWEQMLGRPAPDPTEPGKNRPRLSSRFVEFLMGLDDGHVTGVGLTRNQELKALGNGVVPQQGAAALRHLHHIRMTYTEGDPS